MSGKFALIIGNTEYTDPGLAQLTAPGKDAEDFARVLKDKEIGAFDNVKVIVNKPSASVIEAIDEFFDQKKHDDMLVLYFSGHGIKDEIGSLYLAFNNTIRSRLRATAIKSDYIREAMDQSRSKRQVLILDCCNSGAFPPGTKAEVGGAMGLTTAFQGYGRFVLTASNAIQFAWDSGQLIGETKNSLFTHFLVKGLEGEADSDGDGRITVDELYDYTYDQISRVTPNQTPTKSASKQEGEIVLRQSTRIENIKPVSLPDEIIEAIEDTRPFVREVTVQQLEKLLKGKNLGLARSAREALEKIADQDDSRRVAQTALKALESIRQAEQLAAQRIQEEKQLREQAELLAAQKAEEERIAHERKEEERRAREELEHRVREKVEAEWKAQEEAKRLASQKAKEEAEQSARQKAEKLAHAQAEREAAERAAIRLKVEREATEKAMVTPGKTASPQSTPQPQPILKWVIIGILGLCVIGAGVVGIPYLTQVAASFGAATETPATRVPATEAPRTEAPAATNAPAEPAVSSEKVQIRWLVGLGTGTDAHQITTQEEVVADFNASQDSIELVLEVVPFESARDTLSTQIASGAGPDIVGPVGWGGSNDFYGQWLDIGPYIESSGFDTSIFDPALVKFYQTEEGQVGLPFAVFPGAMYFIPALFDEAGLAYPPQKYGEKYVLDGNEVDWNWETITEVAKRLTIDTNGRNSTEASFNRNSIVQVGYSPQWQSIQSIGTFYGGAAKIYEGNAPGLYISTIPNSWKQAWKWYYDGMWGAQPFIATGPLSGSPEFGAGNVFASGKAAMGLSQTWYTCCLGDFRDAGNEFQLGIQPIGANGEVAGRVDADTFRIWKGTKNPEAAFTVLSYLITTGADKLLPVYGAMPAVPSKTQAFFDQKSQDYPFVTQESWDVFLQGLAYPDSPSSEQYQPNSIKANARFITFFDLLNNTPGLNFDAEFQKLVDDLNSIYNE